MGRGSGKSPPLDHQLAEEVAYTAPGRFPGRACANHQFATLARSSRPDRAHAGRAKCEACSIAEAVDRLEKQRKSAMAAVAAAAAAAPEITGTVKPITFDARNLGIE